MSKVYKLKVSIYSMEGYKYKLVVKTPVLAGYSKKLFSFRVFAKLDFSEFKIVDYRKLVTQQDLEEYAKKKKVTLDNNILEQAIREIVETKSDYIEDELEKQGLVKLDYLFERKHYNLDTVKTLQDYINWIDFRQAFARPIYYKYLKEFNQKVALIEAKPIKVNLIVITHYYSKTQSPVFFEALGEGTEVEVTLNQEVEPTEDHVKKNKNMGYGLIEIQAL